MRLFSSLMWRLMGKPKIHHPEGFKGPKGHIYRGKFRIVKKVTNTAVNDLKEFIKIEENNMLLLRNPYITQKQSSGHAQDLKKHEKWQSNKREEKAIKFTENPKRNKSLFNYLERLRVNENWDRIPS